MVPECDEALLKGMTQTWIDVFDYIQLLNESKKDETKKIR